MNPSFAGGFTEGRMPQTCSNYEGMPFEVATHMLEGGECGSDPLLGVAGDQVNDSGARNENGDGTENQQFDDMS